MSLTIYNNLMAENVNRNLSSHYGRLGKSTQRLSSGLRVNSASDDAAGLAIRELMRADIAAVNQGIRNANDGISMIQTADGALGVIDAKLIRMKELAEQAATGTYTDSQRKMIDQEYQLMANEITRIASDTDFNSKKLLSGTGMDVVVERSSAQDDPARSEEAVKVETVGYEETWRNQDLKNENLVLTAPARRDGTVTALGRQKITTTAGGTGTITFTSRSGLAEVETSLANANANGEICTMGGRLFGLALGAAGSTLNASTYSGAKVTIERSPLGFDNWTDITDTIAAGGTTVTGEVRITLVANDGSVIRDSLYNNTDEYRITKVTDTNFTIQSVAASTEAIQVQSEVAASKTFEHRSTSGITVTNDATTFFEVNSNTLKGATAEFRHNGRTGALTGNIASVESSVKSSYGTEKKPVTDIEVEIFNTQSNTWEKLALGSTDGNSVDILDSTEKFRITTTYGEDKKIRDTISNNTGGRFTVTKTQFGASLDMKTGTDAQKSSTQLHVESEDLIAVNIHFGTSSQKEDHYDTEITMATAKSLGVGQEAGDNILTQQNAKKALENITLAINKKDKIRAEIGSTQNRLAATVEVGSIQKENLQASESRISDVNVATEMTTFNKQQILANAAVSMLAQANNLPKLAQKLLG